MDGPDAITCATCGKLVLFWAEYGGQSVCLPCEAAELDQVGPDRWDGWQPDLGGEC